MHDHLVVEPRAEDVGAQQTGGLGRLDGLLEHPPRADVLAPDVDEGRVAADRVGRDQHPLDQGVGIALEDVAVLERPRLALVGVDDEIDGARALLRDEAPLRRRREAGAAQAAEVRLLDLGRDALGTEPERLPERLVAAARAVAREGPRLRPVEVPREHRLAHRSPSSTRSIGAAVERPHVLLVDLHHRGGLAGAEALHPEERDAPVRRGLARRHAEPLLEIGDDVLRPPERARQVVADRDHVPPDRLLEEQRVEGDDLVDVGGRHLEQLGHVDLDLGRDEPEGLLGHPEHGEQRRLPLRVERLEAPHLGELGVREPDRPRGRPGGRRRRAHRSSSPPIMLTDPKVGTMSATIPPSSMRWSAAIGGRHGGRHRTRYGRSVPSDTM